MFLNKTLIHKTVYTDNSLCIYLIYMCNSDFIM